MLRGTTTMMAIGVVLVGGARMSATVETSVAILRSAGSRWARRVDSLRSGPHGAGSPGRPDCGKAVVGEPRGL
jgi:hypothetical protein